mmetsp:Transcript_66880/g.189033  ORF Transcript_66880/g.189033 Transcript_66880/m.189033 type:complete len:279 (-) Transcript_66880:638-1474(-)
MRHQDVPIADPWAARGWAARPLRPDPEGERGQARGRGQADGRCVSTDSVWRRRRGRRPRPAVDDVVVERPPYSGEVPISDVERKRRGGEALFAEVVQPAPRGSGHGPAGRRPAHRHEAQRRQVRERREQPRRVGLGGESGEKSRATHGRVHREGAGVGHDGEVCLRVWSDGCQPFAAGLRLLFCREVLHRKLLGLLGRAVSRGPRGRHLRARLYGVLPHARRGRSSPQHSRTTGMHVGNSLPATNMGRCGVHSALFFLPLGLELLRVLAALLHIAKLY